VGKKELYREVLMERKFLQIAIITIIIFMTFEIFNKTCIIQSNLNMEKYHNISTLYDNYYVEIQKQKTQYAESRIKMLQLSTKTKVPKNIVLSSRSEEEGWIRVKVTAYDISKRSTGKGIKHPAYGITATGFNLKGKNYKTARVIAVDPDTFELKSKVRLRFIDELYRVYDSIYSCEDTGSKIKNRHIDLFLEDTGEKVSQKALDFGVTEAYLQIIDKEIIDKNK
jgi:3D (Asp-Asp-Asp) domain-containing protein